MVGSGDVAYSAALRAKNRVHKLAPGCRRVITQMTLVMDEADDQSRRHSKAAQRGARRTVRRSRRGGSMAGNSSGRAAGVGRAARADCRMRNAVMRMDRRWLDAVITAWVW